MQGLTPLDVHSRVRDDAGVAFSGAVYDQDFVLADVDMEWPLNTTS